MDKGTELMGGKGSGEHLKKVRWQKGQSGNPAGRAKKGESLTELLREIGETVISSPGKKFSGMTYKKALVKKMWHSALSGSDRIGQHIFDRLDGPVKQVIEQFDKEFAAMESLAFDFIRNDLLRSKQFVHQWYKPAFYHRIIADVLQDDEALNVIIVVPPQHGKELSHDTPMLTPNGWTTHGELLSGDYVYGLNGKPKKIIATSAETECTHTITFSDGSKFDTHYNHVWVLEDKKGNLQKYSLKDLLGLPLKNDERNIYYLPKRDNIEFEEKEQLIDPYLLGFWLGDGESKSGVICKPNKKLNAVCEKIKRTQYKISDFRNRSDYDLSYCTIYGLTTMLKELNLYNNKHIPANYLFCKASQRLELLAGLIDSDGAVFYDDRIGDENKVRITFTNTNYDLIEGVKFICDTFGWRTYILKQPPIKSSSGILGKKPCYQISFTPDLAIPTALYDLSTDKLNKKYRRIALVDIQECKEKKKGKCIQVEDSIYLAGWGLIPTHNSEIVTKTFPAYYIATHKENSIILGTYNNEYANELSVKCRDFMLEERFHKLFGNLELHPDQQTKHKWSLKGHEGAAIFAGVSGTITGNPSDIFLVDDIDKDFEDASSRIQQEKKWNWYNYVADNRLRGEKSRKIIVTTRWVKHDLVGRILRHEEETNVPPEKRFRILHFPAILDVQGNDYATGRPLWPEVKSMNFLLERQKKDPAMFKALWMGNPRNLEGCIIKPEWIKIENDLKSLGKRTLSCRGWDFGYTENGDWTVGARIDIYENGEMMTPILADVVMIRKDPGFVKEFVIQTAQKDGPDTVLSLESGGTQIAMAKDIARRKELMNYNVRLYTPEAIRGVVKGQTNVINNNKVARALAWILKLEDGHFRLAKGSWNKEVLDSLVDFSDNCEHDDIEDAITNAWKTLFGKTS